MVAKPGQDSGLLGRAHHLEPSWNSFRETATKLTHEKVSLLLPPTTRVHSESSTREGCPTVQEPKGGLNSQSLYLQLVYGHKFKLSSAIRSILANPIHLLFKEISHFLLDFL